MLSGLPDRMVYGIVQVASKWGMEGGGLADCSDTVHNGVGFSQERRLTDCSPCTI